jgi:hypothetical protein
MDGRARSAYRPEAMRFSRFLLILSLLALTGCAAAFRESRPRVRVDSDPTGAQVKVRDADPKPTPADFEVERSGTTDVVVTKTGYQENRGIIKKRINGGWVALDVVTCVIPVALCIPLLVDAITGAWNDVQKEYHAKLEPASGAPAVVTTVTPPPATSSTVPVGAGMSESERKAAARAAYLEGAALQEKGDCPSALQRFEAAQKLYDAPTHLLHIAQCQAATGKLVEAQETYETLVHKNLTGAPDPFRQAQDTARKELPALQPRIPTLRVNLTPPAAGLKDLVVQLNGARMPNELMGIARPVNPGDYTVTASASGFKPATVSGVKLGEGDAKSVDVKLVK